MKKYRRKRKNPQDPKRSALGRAAYKMAHMLYKHFKETGVPQSVIDRISPKIRHYVVYTLELNGVKIVKKNPSGFASKRYNKLASHYATCVKTPQTCRKCLLFKRVEGKLKLQGFSARKK